MKDKNPAASVVAGPCRPVPNPMVNRAVAAPVHLNAKFFGMTPLPTFGAHDVMKNPELDRDFVRFDAHISAHFQPVRTPERA